MLEAGEDARFIARRLVILASEDVGLADPTRSLVADAAARAVEFVGLPEAGLNLAHAVIHLVAGAQVEQRHSRARCRAASGTRLADRPGADRTCATRTTAARRRLGHGEGYVYPHDTPKGWVPQEHLPAEVAGERFYRPGRHGAEREAVQRSKRSPAARAEAKGVRPMETSDVIGGRRRRRRRDPAPARSIVALLSLRATLRTLRAHGRPPARGNARAARRCARRGARRASTRSIASTASSTPRNGIDDAVDGAQRMAYKRSPQPVVKAMAFGTGVSRAAHRLREGEPPHRHPRGAGRSAATPQDREVVDVQAALLARRSDSRSDSGRPGRSRGQLARGWRARLRAHRGGRPLERHDAGRGRRGPGTAMRRRREAELEGELRREGPAQ